MKPEELLSILQTASKLKTNTRHNWTDDERAESVADHSWRIALMAMLLDGVEEFQNVNINKVIRMCLIHDLGEAFTGDIPTFLKTEEDSDTEDAIFDRWVETFPSPQKEEWQYLLKEMAALETPEARLYKALDKLEAVIAHNEADIHTWLPLEYDLQKTYPVAATAYSDYLTQVRLAVDDWTDRKIAEEKPGNPGGNEYK